MTAGSPLPKEYARGFGLLFFANGTISKWPIVEFTEICGQDPGLRRQAFYNNLPPGKYKFRVIARNNDGVWNEAGATVEFNLIPAFYQTTWFYLLCFAISTYLVWFAYQWRVKRISTHLDMQFEERLAERTRIAQDLHDTLLQGVLSASIQLMLPMITLRRSLRPSRWLGACLS